MNTLRPVPPPAPDEEPEVQLCTFLVGTQEYAVDIMRVDEILRPQKVTPVPGAPSFVEGVLNLRGQVVPVIHVARRLGIEGAAVPKRARLLVCRLGNRKISLSVDGISEVFRCVRSEIKPAPVAGRGEQFVVGVCGPPERLRLLLDVRAVAAGERGSARA